MRKRALFPYVLLLMAISAGTSACGSGSGSGSGSYADAGVALSPRHVDEAVLKPTEADGYQVDAPKRTEHANLPAWRTDDSACAPLLDTLGPNTLGAVRSVYATFRPAAGGAQPAGLKLGTYDSDGARRAMDKLSGTLTSCRAFDVTGPLSRAYRAKVELPSGTADDAKATYTLDMTPLDARNPHLKHEVYAVRTGGLTSVVTVENTLSGGLPGAPPAMVADQVRPFLDHQTEKLKRPVDS